MMQEFVQQISDTVKRGIRGIHTAMPGKVLAFDPGKCVATVQPAMKYKKPDGKTIDFPQITGVPVVFPQGAGQNGQGGRRLPDCGCRAEPRLLAVRAGNRHRPRLRYDQCHLHPRIVYEGKRRSTDSLCRKCGCPQGWWYDLEGRIWRRDHHWEPDCERLHQWGIMHKRF